MTDTFTPTSTAAVGNAARASWLQELYANSRRLRDTRLIYTDLTTVNSSASAGDQDAVSRTLTTAQHLLAANGNGFRIHVWGGTDSNVSSKEAKLKVGGTLVHSCSLGANATNEPWEIWCDVFRTGAAAQKFIAHDYKLYHPTVYFPGIPAFGTLALDETASIEVKLQTNTTGGVSGRIIVAGMTIEILAAA